MDVTALASMVTTIILVALIGGIVLLRPIAKRAGLLLEQKLHEKQVPPAMDEVRQLRERLQLLEDEFRMLNERQHFTEQLLSRSEDRTAQLTRNTTS